MIEKYKINVSDVEDLILGCAFPEAEQGMNLARNVVFLAGLPNQVGGVTVNRFCASSMQAIHQAVGAIKSGSGDLFIAGGVENMTRGPWVISKVSKPFGRDAQMHDSSFGWRFINPKMKELYGVDGMGNTAENLAEKYNISREDQDKFAYHSQKKATHAQCNGRLAEEIVPVEIPQRKKDPIIFKHDEFIKGNTSLEILGKLRTAFKKEGGSVTAGNASGVNDGAAALLIASERAVEAHGMTPLAEITGSASAGVEPRVMGIGPVPAILKLCERLRTTPEGFEVVELNEAFASQAIACCRELGLDPFDEHINPNGGAIALGHPLGMTGARIVGTTCLEINIRKAQSGLVSMCVGVGQGVALSLALPT